MYLLDTNVVSELRLIAAGRGDMNVAQWQARTPPALCRVSVITLLEIEIGILQKERRDRAQGHVLRQWFEQVVKPAANPHLLNIDQHVAARAAHLQVPNPRPALDALLAATALVHGLIVVTRNTRDFINTGAQVLNPWEHGTVQESRGTYG